MTSDQAAPGAAGTPAADQGRAPDQAPVTGEAPPADRTPAAGEAPDAREPAPPEQSREDTDAAWGEYPEPSDDHLYRDRPPHWADY